MDWTVESMKCIKRIDHRLDRSEFYSINRFAVRAVILKQHSIFLVKLKKTNEYKFPGGGVEMDESKLDALKRETKEEIGATIKEIISELGYIDQLYPDKYVEGEVFSMRSFYYLVNIKSEIQKQALSQAEEQLGFEPEWVNINDAIRVNQERLERGSDHHWTERELTMLKYIKNHMMK